MENQLEVNIKDLVRTSLVNGVILSFAVIILSMLVYVADPGILAVWWLNLSLFLISLIITWFLGFQYRKSIGGFITFRNALLSVFLMLLVSSVFTLIYNYVLFAVIDPELSNFLKSEVIANTTETLEGFGMSQEQIDESLAQIEGQDFTPSLSTSFKSFTWGILFNVVFAAIIGGILAKKPKMFEETT